jgi:hypothetical protein
MNRLLDHVISGCPVQGRPCGPSERRGAQRRAAGRDLSGRPARGRGRALGPPRSCSDPASPSLDRGSEGQHASARGYRDWMHVGREPDTVEEAEELARVLLSDLGDRRGIGASDHRNPEITPVPVGTAAALPGRSVSRAHSRPAPERSGVHGPRGRPPAKLELSTARLRPRRESCRPTGFARTICATPPPAWPSHRAPTSKPSSRCSATLPRP